jgi:hypothetical protein
MPEAPRIFISHAAADRELGGRVAEFLRASVAAQLRSSAGADGLAALQQQLAAAEVVIGVITSAAFDSGEVPFQLGAAWALGKRLVLLLQPDERAHELYLPTAGAEVIVLGADALIELATSLGGATGATRSLTPQARDALFALFPAYGDRSTPVASVSSASSTQQQWPLDENGAPRPSRPPEAAAPASTSVSSIIDAVTAGLPRPGLPSRDASLRAGRAVSDCLFNRDQGGPFAPELDAPFGAFLAALDGNWTTLRKLEDLDVWLEVADNLLESLLPSEEHVRFWYEVGFQLATLINLCGQELGGATPSAEFSDLWQGSLEALRISGRNAGIDAQALAELVGMLENLRGPSSQRDYANLGRVQDQMRAYAGRLDAELAVVA